MSIEKNGSELQKGIKRVRLKWEIGLTQKAFTEARLQGQTDPFTQAAASSRIYQLSDELQKLDRKSEN